MSNKLIFTKVRAKNFRSLPNNWMELDYLVSDTTLIVSKDNGAGKSTLSIWALYYALFGKAYKKGVKIASLINSRSNKDLVVEVEFETKGSKWLIRRGQKPSVFDIECDGKRVEDEAALKDYQAYLESVIGMDEVAFCFVIALGPDKFVPFSSMSAGERRSFVEQVLDITIISTMNEITKDRLKLLKKAGDQLYYEIGILESKVQNHKRTLGILSDKKTQRLSDSSSELQTCLDEQVKINDLIKRYDEKLLELNTKIDEAANKRVNDVITLLGKFKDKADTINRSISGVMGLENCPTCKQVVSVEHKTCIKDAAEKSIKDLEKPVTTLQDEFERLKVIVDSNVETLAKIAQINHAKIQIMARNTALIMSIQSIQEKMVDSNEDALIDIENSKVLEIESEIRVKSDELQKNVEGQAEHNVLILTLKDDAVKAQIVKEYIPFLNSKINDYLDSMNLYIQMSMDEEFNITMYAPDRKGQTVDNLSTGQLRRVDLAVLLSWREVARSKASLSTNLLILDEILENLSEQGVSDFLELWANKYSDKDINLFVISQRNAEFEGLFDRTLMFALKDDKTVEV